MRSYKLREAFRKVLHTNKLKHPGSGRQAEIIKMTDLCMSVLDAGSIESTPSLTIKIRGMYSKAVYIFNSSQHRTGFISNKNDVRSVFYTSIPWLNPGQGSSLLINIPNTFELHGPQGLREEIDLICSSLLSHASSRAYRKRPKFICCGTGYDDEFITVKKLFLRSDKKCPDSKVRRDTAAYLCQVKDMCRREIGFHKTDDTNDPWVDLNVEFPQKKMHTTFHPLTGELISKEVTSAGIEPPNFLVLECPTIDHFADIEQSKDINEMDNGAISLIVHMTPDSVLKDASYQNWMKRFDGSCTHLILNNSNNLFYNHETYLYQSTLHTISPELFPAPNKGLLHNASKTQDGNIIRGFDSLEYLVCNGRASFVNLNDMDKLYEEAEEESEEMTSFALKEIENLQRELNISDDSSTPLYFPRLCVLGCGSSQYSKYRNQPGFLLRLSPSSSILIDCGYGSLARIYQQFGEETEAILASIHVIFISHIHMDHHLGFLPLVRAVVNAKQKIKAKSKTYCLMTNQTCQYYIDILKKYAPDLEKEIACETVVVPASISTQEYLTLFKMSELLGIESLRPVIVKHGVETHGLILVTKCGKKIVYSSDTMAMSPNLIRHGKNADLLIHDCLYMENEWELDATLRRHSYLKGALSTSEAMNAKFTLLTHFAPFLPVVPPCDIPPNHAETTALANDFLNVSISDLHKLPKLRPVFETVFEESLSKFQAKYDKLKQRQERKTMKISWTARTL